MSWGVVCGITNMVGREDPEILTSSYVRKNLGFNTRIWFDTRNYLPSGIPIMLSNSQEAIVNFIFEHVPSNFCIYFLNIKQPTKECSYRIPPQTITNPIGTNSVVREQEMQSLIPFSTITMHHTSNHIDNLCPSHLLRACIIELVITLAHVITSTNWLIKDALFLPINCHALLP